MTMSKLTVSLFLLGLALALFSFIIDIIMGTTGPIQVIKLGAIQFVLGSMYIIPQYKLFGWDTFKFYTRTRHVVSPHFHQETIKLPMSYILVGNISEVLGISVLTAVKYTPLTVLPLTAVFTYAIGKEIYSETAGLWAGLILTSIYWHSNFHVWATNESLALPLAMAFLFLGVRTLNNYRSQRNVGLGVKTTVSVLAPLVLVMYHHLIAALYCATLVSIVAYKQDINIINRVLSGNKLYAGKGWKLGLVPLLILVGYWAWFQKGTILHFAVIIPGSVLSRLGYVTHSTPVYFPNLYTFVRLSWTGSRYQYAIGLVPLIVIVHRMYNLRRLANREEAAFATIVGLLAFGYGMLRVLPAALTPRRVRTLAWIFLGVLVSGSAIQTDLSRSKVASGLLATFVIVNIGLLPFHVLHPDISPAWEAREQAFGYEKAEYESTEWISTNGVNPVATDNRYEGPLIMYNVELAEPTLRDSLIRAQRNETPGYVFSGFSTRAWIQGSTFATQDPPKYGTVYDRIFTTSAVNIYLRED